MRTGARRYVQESAPRATGSVLEFSAASRAATSISKRRGRQQRWPHWTSAEHYRGVRPTGPSTSRARTPEVSPRRRWLRPAEEITSACATRLFHELAPRFDGRLDAHSFGEELTFASGKAIRAIEGRDGAVAGPYEAGPHRTMSGPARTRPAADPAGGRDKRSPPISMIYLGEVLCRVRLIRGRATIKRCGELLKNC